MIYAVDEGKNRREIFPVGSIYMSVVNTNPSTLFGGTWEQIKDKFLLSAGDTYAAGATGGEAQHTLTVNEIPAHSHEYMGGTGNITGISLSGGGSDELTAGWGAQDTDDAGGGQAHNNMPPYLTVYMWKRVS